MLKKVFKIGVVMSLLLTTTTAFAQDGKAEYPRYGFWSNWALGFSADLNQQYNRGAISFGDNWRGSTNIGMDIFAQKKVTYWMDMRFRLGFPNFWEPRTGMEKDANGDWQNSTILMDRHGSFSFDLLLSINNAIYGYDPDRRWNLYVMLGGGLAYSHQPDSAAVNYGHLGVLLNGGLGVSYRFTDNSHLFLEYGVDVNADVPDITKLPWHHTNGILRLGYFYNFGATSSDQAIAAQKSMLTQENFSAVNNQVSNLESQVAAARNNEKKLENRIAQLEDQLKAALANQGKGNGNSAAADSLQAVINQIKADQLNFYAMPFSVQYDVNEWQVSEEEMDKVKAVARVLKDNESAKIMVVGFADYTGSDQYNMKLSEKRANEVKRLLTKKYGIAEDRIKVDYKGKSVAFGDIQYALNRRVSFYRVID